MSFWERIISKPLLISLSPTVQSTSKDTRKRHASSCLAEWEPNRSSSTTKPRVTNSTTASHSGWEPSTKPEKSLKLKSTLLRKFAKERSTTSLDNYSQELQPLSSKKTRREVISLLGLTQLVFKSLSVLQDQKLVRNAETWPNLTLQLGLPSK